MATRIRYIPNRVIDTNGIADGASIYVYQTGTTTPVSIYSDSGLTTPLANPYSVNAGAPVPEIFSSTPVASLRVRVVSAGGDVISDDDPYDPPANAADLASTDSDKGAALVGYIPDVPGATGISVNRALRDSVLYVASLPIANDGVTDDSTLILAALTSGAPTVSFKGVNAAVSAMTLTGVTDLEIRGDGGELKKVSGAGSNSMIFNLRGGCKRVKITGFGKLDGGYDSSNATTGSNPVILIGDQSGNGDGGAENEDIDILFNRIVGANWAGVIVYGRSNDDETVTPTNRRIRVNFNTFEDCGGSAVFVYKNAYDISVNDNLIDGMAYNGIVFDTMAASDSVGSEPIGRVRANNNTIRNFGKVGQGEGILFKGMIDKFYAVGNVCEKGLVTGSGSFQNWGILVNKDAAGASPTNGLIDGGFVDDVQSSALGGALGINIGEGCKKVTVSNVRLKGVYNAGLYISAGCEDITLLNIDLEDCGHGFYMMRAVGTSEKPIKRLRLLHCTARKTSGASIVPTGGFTIDYCNDLEVFSTSAPDFTTSQVAVTNSTWASGWLFGSKTHDWGNLSNGAQQSTTVTVNGAAMGDFVEVSHSVSLSGTRLWGEVSAANTVTVYHRNDTGSAVDVASGTLKARVRKS